MAYWHPLNTTLGRDNTQLTKINTASDRREDRLRDRSRRQWYRVHSQ